MELSLLIISFLSATILPFSSEVAFLTAIKSDMLFTTALFFASVGNILGIILNYYLGLYLYEKTSTKLNSSQIGKKAISLSSKYGYYALLLSWLPIIGDPITLVAGLARLRFIYYIVIAGGLRVLRYYIIGFLSL